MMKFIKKKEEVSIYNYEKIRINFLKKIKAEKKRTNIF